ncbi:alpha-2,8-sialyltransferase 8F isoform X2 [Aquarana catesbeiana]|uniref:alpha-2,8-sialyltransferase 8F isoform X2 n=1 Tax=Aquarana catesbeiana TaxID=8400 RepID=UPI003CC9994A
MRRSGLILLGTSLLLVLITVWLAIGEAPRYSLHLSIRPTQQDKSEGSTHLSHQFIWSGKKPGNITTRVGLVKPEVSHIIPAHNYTASFFCRDVQDRLLSVSLRKRYSEDYYIQAVNDVQNCTWKKKPQEYSRFRLYLSSCCNAVNNFIVSQNNTSLGSNITYEVESKKNILIAEDIYKMLPKSQPFDGIPFKQCAVVGNGGILKNSSCGAEIDQSDFVFRCNLPPIWGNVSIDVGNKTDLVTVNPSIIALKYGKLNDMKTAFLKNLTNYGYSFLLLPAFSYSSNTAISFEVHHLLRKYQAKQKAIFFHPNYLKSLAQFWKGRGVRAYRLSTGFMITSAAIELCQDVTLYGFWPFSKNLDGKPISHHYYDNQLPKPGFHAMPKEFYQVLQLHHKGVLKLQLGECEKR